MTLINDLLKKIKEAIYGEEVRNSIHDAIEQCYKDATGHPDSVAATVKEIGEVSANLSKETADRKAEVNTERKRIDNLIAAGTAQTQEIGKTVLTTSFNGTPVTMNYLDANIVYDKMFNNVKSKDDDFVSIPYPQQGYVAKLLKPGLYNMKFVVNIKRSAGLPEIPMRIMLNSSNSLDGNFETIKAEYFVFPATSSISLFRNVEFMFAINEPIYIKLSITNVCDGSGSFDFSAGDCQITAIDWKGKQSADLSELHDLRIGADGVVHNTAGEAVRKQIGNLTEDIVNNVDCITNSFEELYKEELLSDNHEEVDKYTTSTFSGWEMKWIIKEKIVLSGFYFKVKGRTDQAENVKKIRCRIYRGIFSPQNTVFDKMLDVNINSANGEEKTIFVETPKIYFKKNEEIHFSLQADKICIFKMSDALNDDSANYTTDGVLTDEWTTGGRFRVWIKAKCYELTLKDKTITADKVAFVERKCEKNIINVNTMMQGKGQWYWIDNKKVTLQSNQYSAEMRPYKVPIDATNTHVTLKTDKTTFMNAYFMVDANLNIIEGVTQANNVNLEASYTIEIPKGTKYLCFNTSFETEGFNMMANYGEVPIPYEPYKEVTYMYDEEVPTKKSVKEWIRDDNTNAESDLLRLPRKFDLMVGDTFEMFYKGIVNCIDSDVYDFEITFSDGVNRGKAWQKKWEYTPETSDVGNKTMTVAVVNNVGKEIERKSVSIVIHNKPLSPTSEKVILCIGDSLTNSGTWCSELRRRMIAADGAPIGYGLSNIKFIGTKENSDGCKYEGYGGWTFASYLSSMKSNDYMNIHGIFDKVDADQHSVYYDSNGVRWKLETIGSDTIKLIRVNGKAPLPQSGTMTWASGGVTQTDIIYTSSEQASGNPFWDESTNRNNFTTYASRMGVSSIDHCIILLGWNDTGASEGSYKAIVKQFIDGILAEYPNCKITLLGLQVPSRNGFANNYGINWKYFNKLQSVWNFNQWYQDVADEYDNAEFVNVSGQFDTENNHSTASFNMNTRNPNKVVLQSNGVHPHNYGYLQIADAAFRNIVNRL